MNVKQTLKAVLGGVALVGCVSAGAVAGGLPPHDRGGLSESLRTVVQQQITVRGQVTSPTEGGGLTGVSVSIKGTARGTGTDENGNFVLENVPADAVLVFSMVGYASHEEAVGNREVINVELSQTMSDLEEVVVVGYGVQKKVTKTGSVSQVKGEDLKQAPVVNVENTLVGRIPGVMALNQGGEPGYDGSRILIRGRNTLNADNA